VIGSDHRGFWLKKDLGEHFRSIGYDVTDVGVESDCSPADYPDYAKKVTEYVLNSDKCFGILVCYSGVGMNIAANRYNGIRAVWGAGEEVIRLAREHNDANVLCFGAGFIGTEMALYVADIFATTEFTDARHLERIQKLG
jgi:RpiB/LacA/LacB family sugar-phosphate isomerase